MARLILKSPYIKKDGTKAVNYAKYIGTRERSWCLTAVPPQKSRSSLLPV